MKLYRTISALIAVSSLLACNANAEVVQANGNFTAYKSAFQLSEKNISARQSDGAFDLTVNTPKYGEISVVFYGSKSKGWESTFISKGVKSVDPASVILLQGNGSVGKEIIPVAGSVFRNNGVSEIHLNFNLPGDTVKPVEVVIPLEGAMSGSAFLSDEGASLLIGKRCANISEPPFGSSPVISGRAVSASSVQTIDIAAEADFEYFSTYGDSASARIASAINAAETIYERDLGLRFNIIRTRIRTSSSQPYVSANPDTLLNELTASQNSAGGMRGADIIHLFTGKNLLDTVVGNAWLGVSCTIPSYSYSLTQTVSSSIDHIIFAHEIGHNLGADHDTFLPRSLMYPMASAEQNFFSLRSTSEVQSHFADGGNTCFAVATDPTPTPIPGGPTPTPTPTPSPTPSGGGGSSGTPSAGGGGTTSTTEVALSVSFSSATGNLFAEISKRNTNANCQFNLALSENSDMSKAKVVSSTSDSNALQFSSKTTKRLSSSKSRIYLRGTITGCDLELPLRTSVMKINPKKSSKTKRRLQVSAKSWIQAASARMSVR